MIIYLIYLFSFFSKIEFYFCVAITPKISLSILMIYTIFFSRVNVHLTVGIITLNVACVAVNNVYDITKLSINDTRNT